MLLKSTNQVMRNYLRRPSFNLVALDKMNELSIFK
jgi:hypothetical protein